MSRIRERKNAGKAARIAKLISLALRIWSSSSIALFKKQFLGTKTLDEVVYQENWIATLWNSRLNIQFQLLNLWCHKTHVKLLIHKQQILTIAYITWMSKARASSPLRRFWMGCISSFSYLHQRNQWTYLSNKNMKSAELHKYHYIHKNVVQNINKYGGQ